jgi:hypothetical protein
MILHGQWVGPWAALAIVACGGADRAVVAPEPPGFPRAEHLVPLLTLDNPRLVETASLIARAGDAREAQHAGERLAALASRVASDAWTTALRDAVAGTMAESQGASLDAEVERRRREALVRIYDAMMIWNGGFSAPPGGFARVTIPITFVVR